MPKILITEPVQKKIREFTAGPAKLLLNYNDGVGPYSKVGSCSIGTDFDLLAVKPDEKIPDYQAQLASPLGTIYYKKYSGRYLDRNLKLSMGSFNQIELSGSGGVIDGGVNLIDER